MTDNIDLTAIDTPLRVLHLSADEKFFETTADSYEKREWISNKYLIVTKSEQSKLRFVKQRHNQDILYSAQSIKQRLQVDDYDILFVHSLQPVFMPFLHYIPKDKIVIWWVWGFDIYDRDYGMSPLIDIPLYKPTTQRFISNNKVLLLKKIIQIMFFKRRYERYRNAFIQRADYIQPILSKEYTILKEKYSLKAQEYYLYATTPKYKYAEHVNHSANGNILIGNSASFHNNHLDIWETIKPFITDDRKVIVPLSYGGTADYVAKVSKQISDDHAETTVLTDFMSKDDYFAVLDKCSYALFGGLRQQAMANIRYCLRNGIKVFLYQDSMAYKHLKARGFAVFAIEDIDKDSFSIPIYEGEHQTNIQAQEKEYAHKREKALSALHNLMNAHKL